MLIKQTDRVYYLPSDAENDRPLLGYIAGDRYSLMIDAGVSEEHNRMLIDDLPKMELKYPDFVVLTHWHWDHSFGLYSLKSVSLACEATNEKLSPMPKWLWDDDAIEKRIQKGEQSRVFGESIKREYPKRQLKIKTADIAFKNGISIDLGGTTCDIWNVNDLHTDDSVIIHIPSEKVLFLGDSIYPSSRHHPETIQKKALEIADLVEKLDFVICFISHQNPVTKEQLLQMLRNN
jgi:glyoxylase-like metal-dependent hydrolase (beta-lactamase superfamily II)